jgi:hypothetical protein
MTRQRQDASEIDIPVTRDSKRKAFAGDAVSQRDGHGASAHRQSHPCFLEAQWLRVPPHSSA